MSHSILFVDDEEKILNSLQRLLRKERYKIFLANSAKEGLSILKKERIGVVVSDQSLPETDGIMFLQVVKKRWPDTIRIMLTGYGFTNIAEAAINKCDVYRFLTKPWNDEEVREVIRQSLIISHLKAKDSLTDKKERPSYTLQKIEKLKDTLIAEKLLTAGQINEALEIRKTSRESLAGLLIRLNYITEEKLLDFLSGHLKIPFASLSEYEIDPTAVALIPEKIARRYKTIPISKEENKILIAMSDPVDLITLADIQAVIGRKGEIQPILCSEVELLQAMERYYSTQGEKETDEAWSTDIEVPEEEEIKDSQDTEPQKEKEIEDKSVISFVNSLINQGVKERASDIHIDIERDRMRIRFRVDGILFEAKSQPKDLYLPVVSRIKIMASMDISMKWIPQDGRIRVKVKGKEIELRVSTYPTIHGESLVLRILDRAAGLIEISDLGLSENDCAAFENIIYGSHGMFLVTGPTGSGKTTTLYSALKSLDAKAKNIITIEEPVEYEINDISQGEIRPRRGLDFANALRAILRHDPDVILVGEIRDRETAQIAFRAAMTGHLVFSTLHTNSAIGSLSRLMDLGVEPFIIGSSLKGVLSQRLVRKICPHCKEEYVPDAGLLNRLGVPVTGEEYRLFRGKGCNMCKGIGYKGRVGVFEFLTISKEIKKMITHHRPESEIEKAGAEAGMTTLKTDGFSKALQGMTTLEEIIRVT